MKITIRFIVGVMIFLGYFLMYVVRYNLSVHIVAMSRIDARPNKTHDKEPLRVPVNFFYWDDARIAELFSAYYIGFCICFPIFHSYGDRFGSTWIVGISGIISGVLNCLTPVSAYYSVWCIIVVRVIIGFCSGAMHTALVQVLRNWVPPVERIHYMWTYCGLTTGTFSALLLCAMIEQYSEWPFGFYVSGVFQIAWAMLWIYIVTDKPSKHPFITEEELIYLTNTIGTIFSIKLTNSQAPWKLILRSVAFWALCILNFGYAWMIMSLCLYGPFFYSMVGRYHLPKAAMLTALPFILRLIFGYIIIHIYHWYKNNTKIRRIKHIRKYFIVISHICPGCILASCWFIYVIPGPILLSIAITLTAAGMDLTLDLTHELTPAYANSLNTVIKIIGNTPGIILPFCVATTTYYEEDYHVWRYIWSFHGTILLVSGIIFLIWGDANVQSWNTIRVIRPPSKWRSIPRPSMMSNIPEVDEDESSINVSVQHGKNRTSLLSIVSGKMLHRKS